MTKETNQAFKVSGAFSSHMVLQRNAGIKVWGTAEEKGAVIYGEFMGEKVSGTVNESGDWTIEFSAKEAQAEPQTLKVYTNSDNEIIFEDILIGDVYLITGQSNAEMTLGECIKAYPEDKNSLYRKNMRVYTQTREFVMTRPETWHTPQKDVINPDWCWKTTTDEAVYAFSAIGYFMGRKLADTLPDLPIGLIMGAAGGSQIIELLRGETAERLGYSESASVCAAGFYNTLLHPFIKMPIRAIVYYQGESECWPTATPDYGRNLNELVKDFRTAWGIPFRFYNVQLSSHGKESCEQWPTIGEIRAIQYAAVNTIPDYYIIPTFDCGKRDEDPDFAHPYYKKIPGERLAALILSEEYGLISREYASSPYVDRVEKKDTGAEITFKYVGDGLKLCNGNELKGFQTEKNGERKDAYAVITGKNTVSVKLDGEPDAICYAVQVMPEKAGANLVNSENIPAPAFKVCIK